MKVLPLRAVLIASVSALVNSAGVLAQVRSADKSVTVVASVRLRVEDWNWFDTPGINDAYVYGGGFLRLGARQDLKKWSWHIEGAAPYLIDLPEDAVAPPPQGPAGFGANYRISSRSESVSGFLKQGFVTLKFDDSPAVKLRAGRFEFSDGADSPQTDTTLTTLRRERIAERLLGPFGFSHIGRSFDGLEFRRTSKVSDLTLLAARSTQGVFNIHGMRELNVGFAYAAFTRSDTSGNVRADARLFGLGYLDTRNIPKADNRPAAARLRDSSDVRILTLGGNLIAVSKFAGGKADLLLWGAWQTGDWGTLQHAAYGYAFEAGAQWKVKHLDPWLRVGYWRGSGDDDPLDDDHGTFFQVLPTPRVYARFPFYNLMNNQDLFLELVLRPAADWTIRSDAHALWLTSTDDSWYAGGGAFEPQTFGYVARPGQAHTLAHVFDTSIDFRATPNFGFTLYIAVASPGRVIDRTYPGTSAGMLGLLEARWRR